MDMKFILTIHFYYIDNFTMIYKYINLNVYGWNLPV